MVDALAPAVRAYQQALTVAESFGAAARSCCRRRPAGRHGDHPVAGAQGAGELPRPAQHRAPGPGGHARCAGARSTGDRSGGPGVISSRDASASGVGGCRRARREGRTAGRAMHPSPATPPSPSRRPPATGGPWPDAAAGAPPDPRRRASRPPVRCGRRPVRRYTQASPTFASWFSTAKPCSRVDPSALRTASGVVRVRPVRARSGWASRSSSSWSGSEALIACPRAQACHGMVAPASRICTASSGRNSS